MGASVGDFPQAIMDSNALITMTFLKMALPEQLVNLRSTYVLRGQGSTIHMTFRYVNYIQRIEMLLRGFTTVRDTGGANAALAEAIDEWLIPGPRLIQCGKALSQTVSEITFTFLRGQ